MPLTYDTGEPVKKGDRVRYAREPGYVEFIADANDPETRWYFEQFGGGCMIALEKTGGIFFSSTDDEEDLEVVARAE